MYITRCIPAFLIVGGWLWGTATHCWAAGDFQRATLRGLPGVWVVVEKLSMELEQTGLTQSHIQHDAEEKLSEASIRVLTQEECWRTPGMPWLYITVALLKAGDKTYAATIAAVLYQEVRLTRNPQIQTFGVTWDAGVHLGTIAAESLPSVRLSVGNLVGQFVADYKAVNRSAEPQ